VPLTRTDGWEGRIAVALRAVRGWTYVRGQTDCITMVCLFIREMTGVDLWPRWAGQYKGLRGALVHLARMADYEQPYLTRAVSNVLGVEPAPAMQARRGDVVEFQASDGPHVGIALHTEAVGFGVDGVYFVPIKHCDHCWSIG